ncbi:hypothetical protein [Fusobacterium sp. oral taxon 370]|uniref:hypothetical protein n=1 Tax=Fusobacterium sp. oral taxon 370 TaxID=712288 RepID=UPI001F45E08E|nr:hypothetical protein [Fusobacterium sp. oral taxon 370]
MRKKKRNSIIITDENFNKIDLIKLIYREIKMSSYKSKIRKLYYSFKMVFKNLTKEDEKKIKIFLKENKIKYKELDEVLEKIFKRKAEKLEELELKKVQQMEEKIRELFP